MSQRPMRLAFYLDDGLVCGGAERVALRLLGHWWESGATVHLVSRHSADGDFYPMPAGVRRIALDGAVSGPGEAGRPARPPGARLWAARFLPFRSFIRLVYESLQLRRVLRGIDADVAVAFLTPGNVKLLLAAGGLRCKVIVSERNDTRSYRYPLLWRVLRRLLYRRADRVTANMSAAIQDMAAYVPESRLALVPNPVDCPPDDALARPDCSKRIVTVGRLVPYKRHLMLIQAFAALADEFGDWELDIVGEGPTRPELESAIASLGLAGRVHLHGLCRDVSACYRAGAMFVLPSRVEGTPNALLEAMAHGLPCIVSDSLSGALDHVDEGATGLAFAAGSVTELTDRIKALVRAPERRRVMGAGARQRLLAHARGAAYPAWDSVVGLEAGVPQGEGTQP
jgi:glycosyltransferase involved in cell wall biosynthesis